MESVHSESTPLVRRRDGASTGVLRKRGLIVVFGLVLACLGAFALESAFGTVSALGRALDATLGRYGVVKRGQNGRLVLLPPKEDTCDAACDHKAEHHVGTYAYYDEDCHMGGFGCNFGKSLQCRACQTEEYAPRGGKGWHYVQCPQCVCDRHNLTGCNFCVSKYKYYRFQVLTTRFKDGYQKDLHCETTITQFSEIKVYTNEGRDEIPLDPSQSAVLEGTLCHPSEGPNAASDGSVDTKMCDRNTIDKPGGLNFVFAARTPMQFTHYEMFTANDCEGRDPTSWTLYGSKVSNQGPWAKLSEQRFDPPIARKVSAGKIAVCA